MAKKQLAHLFDATKCIGCQACIVSCVETNYPEMVGRHIEGKNWLASRAVPALFGSALCGNLPVRR